MPCELAGCCHRLTANSHVECISYLVQWITYDNFCDNGDITSQTSSTVGDPQVAGGVWMPVLGIAGGVLMGSPGFDLNLLFTFS